MDEVEEHGAAPRGWSPEVEIRSEVTPPSSKSHAIRALLAAGLASGTTRIGGLSRAEDVLAAVRVLEGCGVEVSAVAPGTVVIEGLAGHAWRPSGALDLGESGTVARLATALLALGPREGTRAELTARGSLRERSSAPLVESLRAAGATLLPASERSTWPLSLVSAPAPDVSKLHAPVSSQELSGLLLALSASPGSRRVDLTGVLPSRPYAEMTIEVLRAFGARVDEDERGYRVTGPLAAPATPLSLEPDASAAAVVLAAACLRGGATRVRGFGPSSLQGDVAIVEHLRAFGCQAEFRDGALSSRGLPTRGASLDLSGEPDLAPVLAAVAAAVALGDRGETACSRLTGLETLNTKECRRLDVLASALRELGLTVSSDDASLEVAPGSPTDRPLVLDPHGDHRMAFSFALLGLVRPGLTVSDPGCVAKSWPDFWEACVVAPLPENPERS